MSDKIVRTQRDLRESDLRGLDAELARCQSCAAAPSERAAAPDVHVVVNVEVTGRHPVPSRQELGDLGPPSRS